MRAGRGCARGTCGVAAQPGWMCSAPSLGTPCSRWWSLWCSSACRWAPSRAEARLAVARLPTLQAACMWCSKDKPPASELCTIPVLNSCQLPDWYPSFQVEVQQRACTWSSAGPDGDLRRGGVMCRACVEAGRLLKGKQKGGWGPTSACCLQEPDWRARESAILALGAISIGCATGLVPFLPQLVNLLMPNLQDSRPLVRWVSSTCCLCFILEVHSADCLRPAKPAALACVLCWCCSIKLEPPLPYCLNRAGGRGRGARVLWIGGGLLQDKQLSM